MRAYMAYDDSGITELGDFAKSQVLSLIEQADASLSTDKQCGVGFYRSALEAVVYYMENSREASEQKYG